MPLSQDQQISLDAVCAQLKAAGYCFWGFAIKDEEGEQEFLSVNNNEMSRAKMAMYTEAALETMKDHHIKSHVDGKDTFNIIKGDA